MENNYCAFFDSYYEKDGTWKENKCGYTDCLYCSKRPEKHSKKCNCKFIGKLKNFLI